jgi:hypothetical protein
LRCELTSAETASQEFWDEGIVAIVISEYLFTKNICLQSKAEREVEEEEGVGTYSIPEIIFSYSSHHGTLTRSLARAMIALFFDLAGSMFLTIV